RGSLGRLPRAAFRMFAAENTLERAAAEVPESLEGTWFPRMAAFAAEQRALDPARLSVADCIAQFERARAFVFDEFAPQALKPSVLAGLAIQKLQAALKATMSEPEARATAEAA